MAVPVQDDKRAAFVLYEIEELPPVPPPSLWKRPGKKATMKIVR